LTRTFGTGLSEDETEKRNRKGTLFAAGLITVKRLWEFSLASSI
jgi:hypothetical protein